MLMPIRPRRRTGDPKEEIRKRMLAAAKRTQQHKKQSTGGCGCHKTVKAAKRKKWTDYAML